MYKKNELFNEPQNVHSKIWRYMDFPKFVSLLDTQKLFFARADKFEDQFEGSWPKADLVAIRNKFYGANYGVDDFQMIEIEERSFIHKNLIKYFAVNCWHMNEYESAAMWKLYLQTNEGIAIQSTYCSLKECIIDEEDVFLGMVKYIDFEREEMGTCHTLSPFIHKRKSFEHEREVRALVVRYPENNEFEEETIAGGVAIKVNLEVLIKNICVAPNTQEWFANLIRSVCSRYGYDFNIKQSKMNVDPIY